MTRRGIAVAVAALLLAGIAARAAPLDKEGCAKLKVEQAELEHAGARGNMGRGPQWAKTNLEPDKLEQIRRLLEVDEQLLFRCRGKPLVHLPKDTDPDPAAQEPGAGTAKAAKSPKKKDAVKKAATTPADPTAKAAAKEQPAAKKSAPAAKAPTDKTDGDPAKKSAAAAKKAKAKPKVDDAYRAPAPDPGANPFANQPTPQPTPKP
jgi:hypothetical protein